jgi:hypothetical protein
MAGVTVTPGGGGAGFSAFEEQPVQISSAAINVPICSSLAENRQMIGQMADPSPQISFVPEGGRMATWNFGRIFIYFASAFRIQLGRIAMASPYIFHTREACAATLIL